AIQLDEILADAKAYHETLELDEEAYSDFAGRTLLPKLAEHPNMIISKTFSKVLASAGLRVGILIMHPDLAEIFRAVQLPSNVGALTQAVAVKIAREVGVIPSRVELCEDRKSTRLN